ncbi:O-antigen polysaccharide polymerase Wzy [Aerococcus urinaeequi]|uniref:O-antigen polysaccharide polymerase Wzy n=1 Tax=Aerococcus urinaeequi TaxID=51665 RepID=UPI003D6A6285
MVLVLVFNKSYLKTTLLYTLFNLLIFFTMLNTLGNQFSRNIIIIAIFTSIQFILNIFCYRQVGIKMLSLTGVFTLLNYIFHLGQPFIKLAAPNYIFAFDVSKFLTQSTYLESLIYSSITIMAVSGGAMLFRSGCTKEVVKSSLLNSTEIILQENNLFKVGSYIFAFTFPLELYLTINRIITALQSGYLDTFGVELGGLPSFLATFSIVGVVLMIFGSRSNIQRGWTIYALYVAFYLIAMFSGGRMWQIIKILIVTIYFVKTYNIKFTKKHIFWMIIATYFGSGFLAAIADFRSYDFSSTNFISEAIRNVFQNNPILGVLDEFGATVYTVGLVIEQVPSHLDFSWGRQFITGFVELLPNLSSRISQLASASNYVIQLKMPTIGGSFIGELYYSFYYFGIIFAFFVGMLAQYITERIDEGIMKRDYSFIVYSLLFQYSFISWVRGSSPTFYRNTVYSLILIYFINNLVFSNKETILSNKIMKDSR